MKKSTRNALLIGGGVVALLYVMSRAKKAQTPVVQANPAQGYVQASQNFATGVQAIGNIVSSIFGPSQSTGMTATTMPVDTSSANWTG